MTTTVACCPSCGPDCFAVEARIRREGDTVRWEWGRRGARWEGERRTTLSDAGAYDAEVARIGADHSWESAAHRAGRLILAGLALPPGVEGVKVYTTDAGELEIQLEEPDEYQIWVHAPWDTERPGESAAAARAMLAGPAADWPVPPRSLTPDARSRAGRARPGRVTRRRGLRVAAAFTERATAVRRPVTHAELLVTWPVHLFAGQVRFGRRRDSTRHGGPDLGVIGTGIRDAT
ncbi:hypothetical protein GCM10009827_103780 [Dactylosporangium maewongense]|uniref:Uncharacterized protein n=1 Tax=Dactylosporangium maewongense TaxID=634393 RepID=A0ABN2CVX5_9ACTN